MSFVHLHNHTEYSTLDGASRIGQLVEAAARDGQPALAITDHGNMHGAIEFYTACQAAGIKPVLGCELYMSTNRRRREAESTGKRYHHLLLLAETQVGYHNLLRLSSEAYRTGMWYKPRVDWDLLSRHSEGLIATTGCLGGEVLQHLETWGYERAEESASRLRDIFGPDSTFIEVQDHGMPAQKRTNPELIAMSRKLGIPLVATNDTHYVSAEDSRFHDALLCLQTRSKLSDQERFRFESDQHWLKSAAEMRSLFAEVPEACDNTLLIAERVGVELELGQARLPQYPLPEGYHDSNSYLRAMVLAVAEQRWTDVPWERLEYELSVIWDLGFSDYFLIVADLCDFAREHGIMLGPGRGSAAGCAVAYALGITDLDPIEHGLIFERFLNPGRKAMPDIDIDIDQRRRPEMLEYIAKRWGNERVAQIVTFTSIQARAAVRDAARVLDYPYKVGDSLARAMPAPIVGRTASLGDCWDPDSDRYAEAEDLRTLARSTPEHKRTLALARRLEGLVRQTGVHPAAIVVSDRPLVEVTPLMVSSEGATLTQFEQGDVEALGLLKIDFLGLRNLTVISDTLALLGSQAPRLGQIPLDDEDTLAMLARGESIGVFQLESRPMRALLRRIHPTTFGDVAATLALYRPGPMAANMHNDYADRKNGRLDVEVPHPRMAEILAETQGLMIYQEQMMEVAREFAGYSLTEADNLRKACGKKIRALIAAEREKFVQGCEDTGYGAELGTKLFDTIEPFADYAFNKSHAYAYGLVSYWTAWLKAHHPAEYLAALLTSCMENQEKATVYLTEARRLGIQVLPPLMERAQADFSVQDGAIVAGLGGLKGVGRAIAEEIVRAREVPIQGLGDLVQWLPQGALRKPLLGAIMRSGGLDSLGLPRRGMLEALDPLLRGERKRRKDLDKGIMSLFDAGTVAPDVSLVPDTPAERLEMEREVLGISLTGHPLDGYESPGFYVEDLDAFAPGTEVQVAGVIRGLRVFTTRKGSKMATFTLEDATGEMDVVVFPKTFQRVGKRLKADTAVLLEGKGDDRGEDQWICTDVLEQLKSPTPTLRLTLNQKINPEQARDLRSLILAARGEVPMEIEQNGVVRPVDRDIDPLPNVCRELSRYGTLSFV